MSYTIEDFYITPEIELYNMMIISDKRLSHDGPNMGPKTSDWIADLKFKLNYIIKQTAI